MNLQKKKIVFAVVRILSGIVLLSIVIIFLGKDAQWNSLLDARVSWLIPAFFCTLLINISATIRWMLLIRAIKTTQNISFGQLLQTLCIARFIGQFLPLNIADITSRFGILNRAYKVPLAKAGASLLLDRGGDLAVMLAGAPVAVYIFSMNKEFSVTVAGALLLSSLISGLLYILSAGYAIKLWYAFKHRKNIHKNNTTPALSVDHSALLYSYLLSWMKYGFLCIRVYCIAMAFNIILPFTVVAFGPQATQLGQAAGITPGGLGIVEAGWGAVFTYAEIDSAHAAVFIVGRKAFIILCVTAQLAVVYFLRKAAQMIKSNTK